MEAAPDPSLRQPRRDSPSRLTPRNSSRARDGDIDTHNRFVKSGEEIRIATNAPTQKVNLAATVAAKAQGQRPDLLCLRTEHRGSAQALRHAPGIKEIIYGVRIEQATLERYANARSRT